MSRRNNKRSLTIIELLVAVIILFFIMMGVGAIDQAIKRTQKTSQRAAEVTMQVSAAMIHIAGNAALAVGDCTKPGILVQPPGSEWVLMIRQSDNNATIGDFCDDRWVRYSNGPSGRLQVCMDWNTTTISCTNPSQNQYDVARNIVYDVGDAQYNFITIASTRDLYLEVFLKGIYNSAKAAHPIKNPTVAQRTRIHMSGHTWSLSESVCTLQPCP